MECKCRPDNFSNLPIDIIFNIFTRLPLKTLSNSRFVSKSWYNFILNPNFTTSLNSYPCAIFLTRYATFCLIDPVSLSTYETSAVAYDLKLNDFRKNFTISDGWNCFQVVGTVNGLVCFSPERGHYQPAPYYIVNPITRDYVLLPKSPKIDVEPVKSGFGFDSIKNQYKLIRILRKSVEIYTLGSGRWREIQLTTDVPSLIIRSMMRSSVLVNGCLHWITWVKIDSEDVTLILSFDMAREEFGLIRMPPVRYESEEFRFVNMRLVGLNDCICVVDHWYKGGTTDLWAMKEYGVHNSWVKEYVMKPRVFHFLWNGGHEALQLKNDELLLVDYESDLIYYDCKKKVSKRIELLDLKGNRVHVEPHLLVCLDGSLLSPTAIESTCGEATCSAEDGRYNEDEEEESELEGDSFSE